MSLRSPKINLSAVVPAISLCVCLILIGASVTRSSASSQSQPYLEFSHDTDFLLCWSKDSFASFGSRLARSPVLTSPNKQYRAYAEVEAKALHSPTETGYAGQLCGNTSKLFVAHGSSAFQTALVKSYKDQQTPEGNSLRIVDWSSDSSQLLVELVTWEYETHGMWPKTALLYSPKISTFRQIALNEVFRRRFGENCPLDLTAEGLSRNGDVVVKASTYEELGEEYDSCGLTGHWLQDKGRKLVRLSTEFKVEHHGKLR